MVEKRKNLELKKHVATIHSSNKLSLLQRKIANALLFNAYDDLLNKSEHVIHIGTLCKLIGYDSNDHKTIKKSLVNLLATVIEWNLVDGNKLDENGVWNASSIIADASIDGSMCTYSYSNKMKNLLHRPELYGRLNMLVQAQFQSTYGLALYENCIRYQNIEQTPVFDIQKFRKLMGVEDNKYKVFRDFKSRVLDKAIEEVNKYSPITIKPHFQKHGRKVVAIQFQICPVDRVIQVDESLSLREILKTRFKLSHVKIEEILLTYKEGYIQEKINLIEASPSYAQGKIKSLAKYFIAALQDDYQPNQQKNNNKSNIVKSDNKMIDINRMEEYRRFQNKELIEMFNGQSDANKKSILNDFDKHLGRSIYKDIYRRDGLANILIQDQLCLFIKQKFPHFLEKILSFNDFITIVP